MSTKVFGQEGDVVGEVELDEGVFGVQINVPLMHQVVRAQLAAARSGTHSTKTRGDVAGGGKKPWRQKGTGRARQGSTRAPQWTGGGVVFGPKPRDHSMKVPKKMRAGALRSALSARAKDGRISVVEAFTWEEPKTAQAVELLEKMELGGKVLVVLDTPDMTVGKSFRNLPGAQVILAGQLNVYDVLNSDALVFTRAALDRLTPGAAKEQPGAAKEQPAAAEAAPVAETEATA